jgi:hypothetical protein
MGFVCAGTSAYRMLALTRAAMIRSSAPYSQRPGTLICSRYGTGADIEPGRLELAEDRLEVRKRKGSTIRDLVAVVRLLARHRGTRRQNDEGDCA